MQNFSYFAKRQQHEKEICITNIKISIPNYYEFVNLKAKLGLSTRVSTVMPENFKFLGGFLEPPKYCTNKIFSLHTNLVWIAKLNETEFILTRSICFFCT